MEEIELVDIMVGEDSKCLLLRCFNISQGDGCDPWGGLKLPLMSRAFGAIYVG